MPVAPLTEIERAALRELVVVERARAQQRLSSLERTFDEMVDAADLEPPDDEHDPDGTTAYERAQVASLASEARARLTELDRALTEVDEGYGACQRCGEPIGWPRLQALPGTTCCVRCAVSPPHDTTAGQVPTRASLEPTQGDSPPQAGRPPVSSCLTSCGCNGPRGREHPDR